MCKNFQKMFSLQNLSYITSSPCFTKEILVSLVDIFMQRNFVYRAILSTKVDIDYKQSKIFARTPKR